MSIEKICKNCKYWKETTVDGWKGSGYKNCKNEHIQYGCNVNWDNLDNNGDVTYEYKPESDDLLIYEGYAAWLKTGPRFGCIFFELKNDKIKILSKLWK